jgi:ABC-type nitrate/sulfonate/bicarbonate transport system substrate-binding protein
MTTVSVLTFGGVSALPIRVAQSQGSFEAADLVVQLEQVRSSAEIRERLTTRTAVIAHLAPDNVISWVDEGAPIRGWLAGSTGPIALLGNGISRTAELQGRRLGVDSADSGFVTILRRLLAQADLHPSDVELVPIGATRLRYQALVDGSIDGTMLTLPWSSLAQQRGAAVLGDHRAVAPGLLTSCAASLLGWLEDEATTAQAYAAALVPALAWLRDHGNREPAAALLTDELGIEAAQARAVLAVMAEPEVGWRDDLSITASDLSPSLTLRLQSVGVAAHPAETYIASP